ncbi:SET domain-containing protein [Cryphonectria parasitica EP155]|uniref:SET domain-containing protein n=1 Tax=Cryphonectria parasitica (strain ATCC 38755 / EP155) TaxID=660469 RepID=A0A9P4XXM1_CRYP1|nr:SET domain-containing protein [Cryphonectria parasitica EP155]KAF3762883.1 SET domain-containing protein [Cryphonectria parasitica EP155]
MPREKLPLESLPAWMSLNNATFSHVEVKTIPDKGHGLVAQAKSAEIGLSPLITVPRDLLLNAGAVEEYAKADRNFRALLDACGHKAALSSQAHELGGLSTPWTEYIKILDDHVPVPILWIEEERALLRGTSLEPALNAKMLALAREFDEIREKSSDIERWRNAFWDNNNPIQLVDWYRLDAWYRSRVLELPRSGPSMVPCIDMANHSTEANAYYEETPQDEVVLLLRPGSQVDSKDEITISYGSDKPAAEMLFSYGFLDASSGACCLTLPLDTLPDDPLGRAKAHIFTGTPSIQVKEVDGEMEYTSPFAFLVCLNEEDGLEFKILQSSDGGRELRMFWQDSDVTEQAASFETLIADHPLRDVFRLRVNMVISQRLEEQLQQLYESEEAGVVDEVSSFNAINARMLKRIEKGALERTSAALEDQRNKLLAEESVTTYLASMQAGAESNDTQEEDPSENDFS